MTQTNEQTPRITEFRKLFSTLDEDGQERALSILRTLEYAQSVILASPNTGTPVQ